MPPYEAQFPIGSHIRVKSRACLEQFQKEWKHHHPRPNAQLDFAEATDTVKSAGFYHGGDVLYQLSKIPGTWHEECLEGAPDVSG